MAGPTRRERIREATIDEIKKVALKQMAEQGSASLSLRSIAAEMGISAPALYNYYASRDDLVTALILDAYVGLGDATLAASQQQLADDYGAQFLAAAMAFREWALHHRSEFILIYGSPIPGYHAPEEITQPPSIRVGDPFINAMEAAWKAGQLRIPAEYTGLDTPSHRELEDLYQSRGYTQPAAILQIFFTGWAMIQGMVSLELYGHWDFLGDKVGEIFREAMLADLRRMDLAPKH